ncbi:MAG: dTDP-4-dehydrorhamnose reductase [Moraxellaceae bacterium]|nr:MAG: dTDP-4-dehydrorhamnose reductase [Moraxellaceae bacterium]
MRILLFGKNGQLGYELQDSLAVLGELIALDRSGCGLESRFCGDLLDLAGIHATINALSPDVVVNAAAYTAVDQAEQQHELADKINHQAVAVIAHACQHINALLVHYSTDYVFSGTSSKAWTEQDIPEPLNQYGKSKWAGEQAIINSGCHALILRTSWLYGARGHNFIKTILLLAGQRDVLSVVSDQYGTPTSATWIAAITVKILRTYFNHPRPEQLDGIYHLSALGKTSWYDYANFIIEQAGALGMAFRVKTILPIKSADYPAKAVRPANSQLNTAKVQQTFRLTLPTWQSGVIQLLEELKHND